LCQIYIDHPNETGTKLLIENGKAVVKDGKPVFIPMSEEEKDRNKELLG
jgi:hypothetical protein